jgi:7-keto-8-aminopelargonate synthetase-like enzyme
MHACTHAVGGTDLLLGGVSKVITFRHNDMQDLEDKLKKQATIDEEVAVVARC